MFEKFLRANAENFRQRYEGTFGFYKDETGRRLLCRLDGIGDGACSFIDARGVTYRLNADSEGEKGFEFLPPKSQFYNTDGATYLVKRIAARQFQRGICNRNTAIYSLKGDRMVEERVDFPVLSKVYEGAKTAKEIIERLSADSMPDNGFALNGAIALGRHGVFVYDQLVGTYETKDYAHFKVQLEEPSLWRNEVADALKHMG
jgi:hypothetical protein